MLPVLSERVKKGKTRKQLLPFRFTTATENAPLATLRSQADDNPSPARRRSGKGGHVDYDGRPGAVKRW